MRADGHARSGQVDVERWGADHRSFAFDVPAEHPPARRLTLAEVGPYLGLPNPVPAPDFEEEPFMRRPTSRRAVLAVLAASLAIAAPSVVIAKPATGCTSGNALVFLPNPVV